jgi:hypothetical protein
MLTVINLFFLLARSEFNQLILGTLYLATILFYLSLNIVRKSEGKRTLERVWNRWERILEHVLKKQFVRVWS